MIKTKRLTQTATIPTRGSEQAAGLDLYADNEHTVLPNCVSVVPTGIAMAIPDGFVGLVWPRSGLACKHGVQTLAGVIDSDYRGEIKVALTTCTKTTMRINQGDRIAQLLIVPVSMLKCVEVDSLDDTVRGDCGFGSTGR